jgi:hypothetical protein
MLPPVFVNKKFEVAKLVHSGNDLSNVASNAAC